MLGFTPSPLAAALGALALAPLASAHIAFWHPSMWGFNVTGSTFSYDNRPVAPLAYMPKSQWWFHGHLGFPPHKEDVFELPAGGSATAQLACDKGATPYWKSNPGGYAGDGSNSPCPGASSIQYHANNEADVAGCAMAIAYKSDVNDVQPEDFTVFSVNHKCVWTRETEFKVPAAMPACPNGRCICAWFWIHNADSGAEQMYMNGFQCTVTGATGTVGIGKPQPARRCGADEILRRPATPSNCTVGPMQPLYWLQADGNNMFEHWSHNPRYNDLYGFNDGAQDYIFTGTGNISPKPEFIGGPKYTPFVAGSKPTAVPAAPASSSASSVVSSVVSSTVSSTVSSSSVEVLPTMPPPHAASTTSSPATSSTPAAGTPETVNATSIAAPATNAPCSTTSAASPATTTRRWRHPKTNHTRHIKRRLNKVIEDSSF